VLVVDVWEFATDMRHPYIMLTNTRKDSSFVPDVVYLSNVLIEYVHAARLSLE